MVIKKIQQLADDAKKTYKNIINKSGKKPKTKEIKLPEIKSDKTEIRLITFAPSDIAKGVLITMLLLVLGFLIYQIKDTLLLFFVSILFAAALDPTIDKLERYKIPRGVSVIVIFLLIISGLSVFIGSFVPILANQLVDLGFKTQELIGNIVLGKIELPKFLDWLNPVINDFFGGTDNTAFSANIQNYLIQFGEELRSLAGNAYKTFLAISNGVANAILVLLLTYFMTVDENAIDNFVLKLFPSKYGQYITHKTNTIKQKVGEWLRGQIALMIAVGLVTYIGLVIIGVEYAFTLALFAGITELIPVIGPLIGWLAAIPIAANQSVNTLIWVTILYFTVQRLENNLLVPLIMKQATGLHPIIVILSMLIGYEFLGVLGVIISVPVSAVARIFLADYLAKEK